MLIDMADHHPITRLKDAGIKNFRDFLPLLDATSDGILLLDKGGTVLFSNKAAEKLLRIRREELRGTVFGSPLATTGKTQLQVTHKRGDIRTVEMSVSSFQLRESDLVIACLRDITEHIVLRQSLAEQNQKLLELNDELIAARDAALESARLKAQFVANVSHEIRTPMSGIIGMTELLTLEDGLTDEQQDVISEIYTASLRLLEVLNALLDFSKLEAGRFKIEKKPLRIPALLDEIAKLITPSAAKKGLSVEISVDPSLDQKLVGDELKIRQSLLNLAHNAVKFTERGFVRISVKSLCQQGNKVNVLFTVEDSGIGLDQNAQAKLFQPFVQADGSTTRLFGGTGLGLSITKGFVDLMAGWIEVRSEAGVGSNFSFAVPLTIKQRKDKDEPPKAKH
jgi:signal transduction histidine kinase